MFGCGALAGAAGALSPVLAAAATTKKRPPNIVIMLADDLGYHDLGFQGSKEIRSPNLDKLAAGGMRFTDAHVSASVCSPSRAGLLTGRYQQRFGHEANSPRLPNGMNTRECTLGQAMKALGYRTACLGKWHVGSTDAHYPTKRGFDEFWGLREGHRSYWYNAKADDKPGSHKALEHNGKQVKFEGYFTDRLGDRAAAFITANTDRPFFLYLSFTAPHGPLQAKDEDLKTLKTTNPYAAMIYAMDRAAGQVMTAIASSADLAANTMIWFLSDNGGICKYASNAPLGGKKGTAFEGGMRVPFVLSWKGHVPAGRTYDNLVSSLDIFPTCLAAAGGALPKDKPLDGVDLMPFVTGKNKGKPHDSLCWRRMNIAAVRQDHWKLIRIKDYGFALYDLGKDVGENRDLARAMPERVKQMQKTLETWETGLVDPLWREGAYWDKWRHDYHVNIFKGVEMKPAPKKKKN